MPGKIRIGSRIYDDFGKWKDPSYPGYRPIVCLTKSTDWGDMGPYCVAVIEEGPDKGALIENQWHKMKIIPEISYPGVVQRASRYDRRVIWEYPATKFVDMKTGEVDMNAWIKMSDKLCHTKDAVRYPFSFDPAIRRTTLGLLPPEKLASWRASPDTVTVNAFTDLLGIPDGRKQVYFRYYMPAVKTQPRYRILKSLLKRENLLLIDVDAGKDVNLPYYKKTYGVGDNFIVNNTMLWTVKNARLMLHDEEFSCGHCYGLAACLLDKEEEFLA